MRLRPRHGDQETARRSTDTGMHSPIAMAGTPHAGQVAAVLLTRHLTPDVGHQRHLDREIQVVRSP